MIRLDKIKNIRLSTIKSLMIALIIFASAIPNELRFISKDIEIHRPYGNSIVLTLPFVFMLCLFVVNQCRIKKLQFKNPLCLFFLYGIFSVVFFRSNHQNLFFYSVAAWKYVWFIFFVLILQCVSLRELSVGVDLGCKISLLYQSLAGWAYQIAGILIPFAYKVVYKRSGVFRMSGTFQHSGPFSLYISIFLVYFLCSYLFLKKKKYLPYVALCLVDIFMAGARTMIIVSAFVTVVILLIRYRKNAAVKLLVFVGGLFSLFAFTRTEAFNDLFITHNFFEMLAARNAHWVMGYKIMTKGLTNLLMGIGLNNNIDYIISHYSEYAALVQTSSGILNSDFVQTNPIHNAFLISGVELGILGLVLYVSIFVTNGIKGFKTIKNNAFAGYFIIFSIGTIVLYCFQGWSTLRDFSWILIIIIIVWGEKMIKGETSQSKNGRCSQALNA